MYEQGKEKVCSDYPAYLNRDNRSADGVLWDTQSRLIFVAECFRELACGNNDPQFSPEALQGAYQILAESANDIIEVREFLNKQEREEKKRT